MVADSEILLYQTEDWQTKIDVRLHLIRHKSRFVYPGEPYLLPFSEAMARIRPSAMLWQQQSQIMLNHVTVQPGR